MEVRTQPLGCLNCVDGRRLGDEVAGRQCVPSAGHGGKSEIGEGGVQPPPRVADSRCPVAGELGLRGAANVIVAHAGQHGLPAGARRLRTRTGLALPARCPRADARRGRRESMSGDGTRGRLGRTVLRSRRRTRPRLTPAVVVASRLRWIAMMLRPALRVDRSLGQGNEVDVAHPWPVVAGGHGSTDEQVGHPPQGAQPVGKVRNGRWRVHGLILSWRAHPVRPDMPLTPPAAGCGAGELLVGRGGLVGRGAPFVGRVGRAATVSRPLVGRVRRRRCRARRRGTGSRRGWSRGTCRV